MANDIELVNDIEIAVEVNDPFYLGAEISATQTEEGVLVTITNREGTNTVLVPKGEQGDTGATGKGISSIECTSSTANVDVYTITYDDETTDTFEIEKNIVTSVAGRIGAVALTASDISYSSDTVNNALNTLDSRITALATLTEGSTTGDAELVDGRTGADSVTYANIGTAIRTQVSDLKADLSDNLGKFGQNSFSTVVNTTHTQAQDPVFISLPTGSTYYLEIVASASVSVQLVETDNNSATQTQTSFTATTTKTTKTYTAKCNAVKVGLYIYKPASVIDVSYKVYTLDGRVFDSIESAKALIVKYPLQSCASDYFCNFDTVNYKIKFGTTCRFFGNNSILTVTDGQELTYSGATGIRYVVHNGSEMSVVSSVSSGQTVLFAFYAQIGSNPSMCTLSKAYAVNGIVYDSYGDAKRINYTEDVTDRVYLQNKANLVIDGNGFSIDLGTHLTGTVVGGYVVIPYTANATDHIYKVCVAKSETVLADSNYLSVGYNTTLWAIYDDHTKDFKLKPVTSAEDLASNDNSFYYDGTNISINITEEANEYVLADDSSNGGIGLRFANCSGSVSNLTIKFARGACCLMNNCVMTFNNCKFMYSSIDSCFTELNNSSSVLNNCEAFKARYDGFGNRAGETNKSDMTLNNCHGHYCYDDGVSHHNGIFYINGGEYDHNHKGGISSPTYESVGNISNAYIHDNEQYGIYADNTADGEVTTTLVNNCLFKGNDMNYYIHRYNLIGINNVYADTPSSANHIDGGTLTDY